MPAQRLLVCGWGETPFMTDLLRELDAGTGALGRGSEVVLLNAHAAEHIAEHLDRIRSPGLGRIRVRHVRGNPLKREGVAQARPSEPRACVKWACSKTLTCCS